MTTTLTRLQAVRTQIATLVTKYKRDPNDILLLAVSKTKPIADILEAVFEGQTSFGENFVQEGVEKVAALSDHALDWHFIGALQSNKTRLVAEHFSWVHSIDRFKIAERLSKDRPPDLPPLNVCLQINISGENSKSGIRPETSSRLAHQVAALPNLKLRGLMCIPEPTEDFERQRAAFRALRILFGALKNEGLMMDTLSMGMSHDLEAAIAEGATIVRVGTAIFGAREKT